MALSRQHACARAPASVGNVAVGFDVLGHAVEALHDRVTAVRKTKPTVDIEAITGVVTDLPMIAEHNTAGAAVESLHRELGLDFGIVLTIDKGIPLASGLGGSAASAVAATVAANALLDTPLPREQLLPHALAGEAVSSGTAHPDNVAPSLVGGLVYATAGASPRIKRIPVPKSLRCVLVHPHCEVKTREARTVLSPNAPLPDVVAQCANLVGFIAGCYDNDLDLIAASLEDVLIEPQRAHLIPGFADVKAAAIEAGALGCSISGSGPSVFAWCIEETAARTGEAMVAAFASHQLTVDLWISPIDGDGARLIEP